MARTGTSFVAQIQPLIRDKTSGTVEEQDIIEALNRAIDRMRTDHSIAATKRRSDVSVYPDVYEYAAPSDLLEPIALFDRGNPIRLVRRSPSEFWLRQNQETNVLAVDSLDGTKYLLIRRGSAGSSAVLSLCDSLTANGTWSADATTDALGLAVDTATKKTGSGSLRFNVDVSRSVNDYAAIVNSTLTAVNASGVEDKGALFAWVYIPDATYVTGMTARWGDDASNYWENSATASWSGASLRSGWNRVGFDWVDATETGSPDSSSVNYCYIRFDYSSSQTDDTGFRIDDLRFNSPENYEFSYYSDRFVKDSSNALLSKFNALTDTTLLETEWDDILLYLALADCWRIFDRMDMAADAEAQAQRRISSYKSRNPSELKRQSVRYW